MPGIKVKRPRGVSAICIHGWVMVVLSFIYAFSPAVKKIGDFYPAMYSFVVCLQFISFVGIWYMKRWGVELFIITFFAKNIFLVFMNELSYKNEFTIYSVVSIFFLLYFYKRMDINL